MGIKDLVIGCEYEVSSGLGSSHIGRFISPIIKDGTKLAIFEAESSSLRGVSYENMTWLEVQGDREAIVNYYKPNIVPTNTVYFYGSKNQIKEIVKSSIEMLTELLQKEIKCEQQN